MIIVRTPLRLELVGGGTDMAYFYEKQEGRVFNMAVNKWIYIGINPKFDGKIRVSYSVTENVDHRSEVAHTRVRAALEHFQIDSGIEIVSIADVPGRGTGLGSSSSFTVGLVQGLNYLHGKKTSKVDLAETACHLEIDVLREPIGKQDQYSAAFGGLNYMHFLKDGHVDVEPVFLEPSLRNIFHNHLLAFYTGAGHSASNILTEQKKDLNKKMPYLEKMANLVPVAVKAITSGDLKPLARILEQEWQIKKNLAPGISNETIEKMYSRAIKAGAWGGRISGAGGGGFLVLLAPPEYHERIKSELSEYIFTKLEITEAGSEIVYAI